MLHAVAEAVRGQRVRRALSVPVLPRLRRRIAHRPRGDSPGTRGPDARPGRAGPRPPAGPRLRERHHPARRRQARLRTGRGPGTRSARSPSSPHSASRSRTGRVLRRPRRGLAPGGRVPAPSAEAGHLQSAVRGPQLGPGELADDPRWVYGVPSRLSQSSPGSSTRWRTRARRYGGHTDAAGGCRAPFRAAGAREPGSAGGAARRHLPASHARRALRPRLQVWVLPRPEASTATSHVLFVDTSGFSADRHGDRSASATAGPTWDDVRGPWWPGLNRSTAIPPRSANPARRRRSRFPSSTSSTMKSTLLPGDTCCRPGPLRVSRA